METKLESVAGDWLIPFRGRGECLVLGVNMLWRWRRLYVMDNHRLALWCWWQHMDSAPQWRLLHMDYHFDANWAQLPIWNAVRAEDKKSLNRYLNAVTTDPEYLCDGPPMELFRWDNFVGGLIALERSRVRDVLWVGVGQEGGDLGYRHAALGDFLSDPESVVTESSTPWLLDVDLDAFTIKHAGGHVERRATDQEIVACGEWLRSVHDSNPACVVTVALSPENTGGWRESERLLGLLLSRWSSEARPVIPAS